MIKFVTIKIDSQPHLP